jgi:hypothetical protein
VSSLHLGFNIDLVVSQWAVASVFILTIALSMAELASAAPTSGGVRNEKSQLSPPSVTLSRACSFIFGHTHTLLPNGAIFSRGSSAASFTTLFCNYYDSKSRLTVTRHFVDSNTIGCIASVASIDWGGAVQIMAAAGISTNGSFTSTNSKTLFVNPDPSISLEFLD